MVQKMPSIIKNNFIYGRVWNLIRHEEMNAIFLFNGDVGRGKSTGALRFGEDLDPTFSLERVCFSITELLKLVQEGDSKGKLKRGSVIVFDEAAGSDDSIDAREALTHTNKIVSKFTTISRAKGLIIIYCTPLRSQLDKRVRLIGVTGSMNFFSIDRVNKRSRANFYWSYVSASSDKVFTPRPRILNMETHKIIDIPYVTIPLPNKELVKAYKAKKSIFIDFNISKWYNQMKEKRVKKRGPDLAYMKAAYKKAMDNLDSLYDVSGKLSVAMIRFKLGVSDNISRQLKSIIEVELGKNKA